jgi:hypothetical protein
MPMNGRELRKRQRYIKFITYLIVKLKSDEPLKLDREERNFLAGLIADLKRVNGEPLGKFTRDEPLGKFTRDARNEILVHLMFEQTRAVSEFLDAHPETFVRIGGGHYARRADPSKTSRDE